MDRISIMAGCDTSGSYCLVDGPLLVANHYYIRSTITSKKYYSDFNHVCKLSLTTIVALFRLRKRPMGCVMIFSVSIYILVGIYSGRNLLHEPAAVAARHITFLLRCVCVT